VSFKLQENRRGPDSSAIWWLARDVVVSSQRWRDDELNLSLDYRCPIVLHFLNLIFCHSRCSPALDYRTNPTTVSHHELTWRRAAAAEVSTTDVHATISDSLHRLAVTRLLPTLPLRGLGQSGIKGSSVKMSTLHQYYMLGVLAASSSSPICCPGVIAFIGQSSDAIVACRYAATTRPVPSSFKKDLPVRYYPQCARTSRMRTGPAGRHPLQPIITSWQPHIPDVLALVNVLRRQRVRRTKARSDALGIVDDLRSPSAVPAKQGACLRPRRGRCRHRRRSHRRRCS
jgi:hypothetical protein